ncbi:D-aminoacyl-tRNA deacylase [Alkalibacterium pelagium]|uniref:D-aminoacyl-tRNA deacylase n=1 Tax=Alkalibacterium pelagium TaxID=426702 RepID=A0A1H7G2T2_9LACT|nr:D-aminoacyl-tRNA deacylase [Alkalibacterium pelagium]GEN49923.1 D-aminoacyl-tRNA deacylase [Alkalibacterium pelagium]SEK32636.1 D-tyrosyl-tRNA(Tyr) deacylase [Alkalibacterium pelagium]
MRAVIQRASKAKVTVEAETVGAIGKGFVVLLGVEESDTEEDVVYLVRKIANMRIFEDDNEKMNRSLKDVEGEILSISQFTLHADTKKGNRPSFTAAAGPEQAAALYESFNNQLSAEGINVATGKFGAHMEVSLVNDGPVTILIDSKNK